MIDRKPYQDVDDRCDEDEVGNLFAEVVEVDCDHWRGKSRD